MAFTGKIRIRRYDNVFSFEKLVSPSTEWETVKETELPFTEAGFVSVIAHGAAVPSASPVVVKSEL